jgi:hypothetical protein
MLLQAMFLLLVVLLLNPCCFWQRRPLCCCSCCCYMSVPRVQPIAANMMLLPCRRPLLLQHRQLLLLAVEG